MSEELRIPVSQTIKYADGTETVVHYNPLGVKMDEPQVEPLDEPNIESSKEQTTELEEN